MPHILPSQPHPRPRLSRILPYFGALIAAAAAWLSQGHLAFTGIGEARIALLPVSAVALGVSAAAGCAAWWGIRRGMSAVPLCLLTLVALPWVPAPLPSALLLWTGPLALLVWIAVALCLAASLHATLLVRFRGPLAAGVMGLVIGGWAFWQVSPSLPSGDEPHYLVITQSLLKDGDVRIENNHLQRDYRSYFAGDLRADFRVRGRDGEIYSIHAPGVPALVAPAFAVAGYRGAIVFLLLLSAAGSALAWHLAWLVTQRADAAWFGWAAVTMSVTWVFHSFAVFPDGPGAVVTLTGVWALLRAEQESETRAASATPWLLHGAALALLPWMHTRFAAIAGLLGALILLRLGGTPNAPVKAGAFLAVPLVSAVCWLGYFMVIYGTPDPSVPYGGEPGSFAFVPDGLAGLLFDQRFGLLAYAPVLAVAFAGLVVMLTRAQWRRHALELLFVTVPYLVVVTYVAMWWGGTSAPARFFVPVLLWLAIPAAAAWAVITHRGTRMTAGAALVFTVFATAALVLVDGGRLAFTSREEYARWLEWLNGNLDLGRGLPVWWRDREGPLFRGIAIWGAAGAGAWLLVRWLGSVRFQGRSRLWTAAALVFAAAGMIALSVTWAIERVDGRAPVPGQLQALRDLSREPDLLAIDLRRARLVDPGHVPPMMRIEPAFSTTPGGAGRNDRPLFAVPAVPAGEYRLRFLLRSATGWLMLGIGRDQFSLRTEPLDTLGGSVVMNFPVDVRAIMVRGDDAARRNVLGVVVEPLRVLPAAERLTDDYARRAVRYPGAIVYFLDERSFAEPDAFWVGGGRDSSVVVQPDAPRTTTRVMVRNGAAQNRVTLEAGRWREALDLGPGEERQIDVPMDQAAPAALVRFTTSAGFRPSDVDPNSRDDRFLGVWVKVLN